MLLSEFEKLIHLHELILKQRTGTPEELAMRMGISRACLFRYIEKLKGFGAEIKYNRTRNCYGYTNDFKLKIILETNEMKKVLGGKNIFHKKNTSVSLNETEEVLI